MSAKNTRNFCIIAHVDHGKTTLSDRLLEYTNTVSQRVLTAQHLDSMDLEKERVSLGLKQRTKDPWENIESKYPIGHRIVGLDINANHIRGVASGWVTGIAKPVHIGRSTQVWGIEMFDDQGRLSCISRITMSVLSPR